MASFRLDLLESDPVVAKLQTLKEEWAAAPRKILHDAGLIMRAALKREAPVRTGQFMRSIGFRQNPDNTVSFNADYPLSKFIIEGTRPHVIEAGIFTGRSDKRALYWIGADHPVPRVNHPGTRPNDFVKRAYDFAQPALAELLQATGEGIFRAAA